MGRNVLVCPLDWGLGHASRDVRIIENLIENGFRVIIGASNAPLLFLRHHFPSLAFVNISTFTISYPSKGSMAFKMFLSMPKILFGIFLEHRQLKKIINQLEVDIVISDNRYGLWNKRIYSVFISHQIWIMTPNRFISYLLNIINHWFINKFDECWVPDFPGELNITGLLSHQRKLPVNTKYIGILSRFGISEITQLNNKKYDILVILSGPEPQRSIFEKILVNQILESNYKTLIVQGKILKQNRFYHSNIEFVNHLSTAQLQQYIIETPVIVCRSGYSSIMDLIVLKKRAILVPTPGQTEQEYLAKLMLEKKWFYSVSQKKIELKAAIEPLNNYYPQKLPVEKNLLEEIIIALKLSVEK